LAYSSAVCEHFQSPKLLSRDIKNVLEGGDLDEGNCSEIPNSSLEGTRSVDAKMDYPIWMLLSRWVMVKIAPGYSISHLATRD
jgi:hypothetical protein